MVSMVRMAEGDAGMFGGEKSSLRTPLASLLEREKKQTNETEGRGGPEGKTTPKRRRETKDEKCMKTTEPISPLNKHLSWISFSDRRQWKGGGKKKIRGHREIRC